MARGWMTRAIPAMAACLTAAGLAVGLTAQAQETPRIELSTERPVAEASERGVTARLGMVPSADDASMAAPMLEVLTGGRSVLRVNGVSSGWESPQGAAEILEIDPANDTPEVVFTSYSGGAHCCTQVYVATRGADGGWSAVDFGWFDGEGGSFADLDGDGQAEFKTYDNSFLYTFECYACSSAPMKIFGVIAGRLVDQSREPVFQPVHRSWLADMEARQADQGGDGFSPGFYAGWVAEKALLGEGYEAWETMMKAYRGYDDPGFDSCPPDKPGCDQAERRERPFPEALTAFLKEQGYL